jgi:hypothetical protein
MTTTKEEEWKRFCGLIAKERDPHRLSDLVNQLLMAMDERKQGLQGLKEGGRDESSGPRFSKRNVSGIRE